MAVLVENTFKQEKRQMKISEEKSIGHEKRPTGKWHTFWSIMACIALPLIIYYPSMKAPFILDDVVKIVLNPDIKPINNALKKLVYSYNKSLVYEPRRNDPSRPV